MRYVIIVALLLCLPVRGEAWQVVGEGGDETQCSTTTDYVGYSGSSTSGSPLNDGRLFVRLFTPTCASGCGAGKLVTPSIYHDSAITTDKVKICAYLDDGDDVPDSSDTLVGCSSEITSATAVGLNSGSDLNLNFSCSSKYWIAMISDSSTWDSRWTSSGTTYYRDGQSYASPPSTLTGTWTTITSRTYVAFVTLGN